MIGRVKLPFWIPRDSPFSPARWLEALGNIAKCHNQHSVLFRVFMILQTYNFGIFPPLII